MEKFGFVGLPNAGKSSLYNALTGGSALAAPYAFATTDPNIGVAKVFDERLEALSKLSGSDRIVHATVQFNDIGGLVAGASQGEGLGNKFLAGIREVDAIVFVLRAFRDDDVPGPDDPLEHLGVVETELTLADLETVEKQIDKKRKAARSDRSLQPEVDAADAALAHLAEGTPLYRSGLADEYRTLLKPWFLLTNKPVLAIVNVDEEQLADVDNVIAPVQAALPQAPVFGACIQLEAEAAQLDAADRAEMLDAYGLEIGDTFQTMTIPGSSAPPITCSASERSSPPARRRRGLGPSEWDPPPRSAQAAFTPTCNVGSSDPRPSTGMSWWRSGPGPRRRRSERSDRRAVTTSWRTATWWTSGSTCERGADPVNPRDPKPAVAQEPSGAWLVREGKVLASIEIPATRKARARGLLGRTEVEGAMLLRGVRSVHTLGMRFHLDVALLDEEGVVIKMLRLKRNRMSAPVMRARAVIEAEAGAFGQWGLQIGDVLEIRE